MKIAVVGTGGVGGYLGGLLARAGEDVTFVARGDNFTALKQRGLDVCSVNGDFTLPSVQVVESAEQLDQPEVVLVSTKSYDLHTIASQLERVLTPSTIVITLQNGIDNDLRLQALLPQATIYPGLVYIGSTKTAPGRIEQVAGPCTMTFGQRTAGVNQTLEELASRFRKADVLAKASTEIEKALWTKFLFIITFGGMVALCRCPIGAIVADDAAFALYTRVLDEGFAVSNAEGIGLEKAVRDSILQKSLEYLHTGYSSKASMLVDVENQRRTEIDALNGTIVSLAARHGIDVPLNQAIHTAIRLASENYQVGNSL